MAQSLAESRVLRGKNWLVKVGPLGRWAGPGFILGSGTTGPQPSLRSWPHHLRGLGKATVDCTHSLNWQQISRDICCQLISTILQLFRKLGAIEYLLYKSYLYLYISCRKYYTLHHHRYCHPSSTLSRIPFGLFFHICCNKMALRKCIDIQLLC